MNEIMPQNAWFKDWFNSPYYHILYKNRDFSEASDFIKKLVVHLKPSQGSKILDVACGKGRHSKALADMGFDVTGIDLAASSIDEALQLESDNLHFFVHDMRHPFYVNYFDFVFNFFTSFGYFKTQRENDNAIRSITQSIKKEGVLVIDYLNVQHAQKNLVGSVEKQLDSYLFTMTKWESDTHFYKQIEVKDALNGVTKHLSTEKVAKFSFDDFNKMLLTNNMSVLELFGDYNLANYDIDNSPRLIIVAKKLN